MKKIEIEVLSEKTNCPVVQIPGRQFPGVVIQGDSLKNLLNLSEEIALLAKGAASEGLMETASELNELLAGYVSNYESTMQNCGKELPYPKERKTEK